jgi:hypothetical protein
LILLFKMTFESVAFVQRMWAAFPQINMNLRKILSRDSNL